MLKVLNLQQLKAADVYTIAHEPIARIDLMERAATQCVAWLFENVVAHKEVIVFCGNGGNGGDGLAIARLLADQNISVLVVLLAAETEAIKEVEINKERLKGKAVSIIQVQTAADFPAIQPHHILIDALYGFGLNRTVDGLSRDLINYINAAQATVIAIDLPSGLYADKSSAGNTIIKASHTLTFECYKLGLLLAENALYVGWVHVLPIGLHPQYMYAVESSLLVIDKPLCDSIFKKRDRFSHKGSFGHALVIGGSYGKIGAMVLAVSACLRSGSGLVTSYVPTCGYSILQTTVPEAMVVTGSDANILSQLPPNMDRFDSIGVGPGLGTAEETVAMINMVAGSIQKPLVLDADALNSLAKEPSRLTQLFQNTILTPHPKEFDRLFGRLQSDFERFNLAQTKAQELQLIIVLKGHHTAVFLPNGAVYFNTNGNAGMAKGGSGDVLTGIITALLAQKYKPKEAAILGVYIHGKAGDFAAAAHSQEAMTAMDITHHLRFVFQELNDCSTTH